MAKKKKHEEHEEHVNHERWLITYADMITLLMVLFIVLFAIGQTDLHKFKQLAGGMSNSLGGGRSNVKPSPVVSGGEGILTGGKSVISAELANAAKTFDATKALQEKLDQKKLQTQSVKELTQAQMQIEAGLISKHVESDVHLQIDPQRGLVVSIVADKVLFDSGKADITTQGDGVLDEIAPILAGLHNTIDVEGHTDDRPISSAVFPSNWELSTGRAGSVLRYLATKGVDEKRLKASGYADTKPLVVNNSDANRQLNRRVEIVVLSSSKTTPTTEAPAHG